MKFKDILYNLRTEKGISQAKLAKELNLSTGLIGMYENGNRMPSVEAQEAIADYFNVSLDYLMGRDSKSLYYLDPQTAELAKDLSEKPKLRTLLEFGRKADDIQLDIINEHIKHLQAYGKLLMEKVYNDNGKEKDNENNEN